MTPREALKGAVDVRYARVSTRAQKKTLPTQLRDIASSVKALGYTKKGTEFSEAASGTKVNRTQLGNAIRKAVEMKRKGKNVVFLVRDIQRFSRDSFDLGYLYKFFPTLDDSLWSNDIPIVALNDNLVLSTKERSNPNDKLIGGILVGIGGQEIDIRKKQTEQGSREAREQGIVSGLPQNLYYKDKVNPIRLLYEMVFKQGTTQTAAALATGRSKSWAKDTKRKINTIIIEGKKIGNDNLIDEYLDTTDLIREYEQTFGPRFGSKSTKRMEALSRKTSGYLATPWKYPKPSREDLDFYRENFKDFLPKRAGK